MKLDDITCDIKKNLVAPASKIENQKQKTGVSTPKTSYYDCDPIYHGYYGMDDYFYYSMIWSSMMQTNHITIQDTSIYTETGEQLGHVGDAGLDAAEISVLDENTSYDEAMQDAGGQMEVTHDDYQTQDSTTYSSGGDDSSNWFESGSDSSSDSYSSSSCSSCSSCGGD